MAIIKKGDENWFCRILYPKRQKKRIIYHYTTSKLNASNLHSRN